MNKSEENLKLYGKEKFLTPDEAKSYGKMGGIASGEARRKNKVFGKLIEKILEQPVTSKMADNIKAAFSIKGEDLTLKEAMIYAQTLKAISSEDTQAFNALIDRVDGKPIQQVETNNLSDIKNTIVITDKELEAAKKKLTEEL